MEAGHYVPKAVHQLPEAKSEFQTTEEKTTFVTQYLDVITKATTHADNQYNRYLFLEAYAEYMVACEGTMTLIKLTLDDANF